LIAEALSPYDGLLIATKGRLRTQRARRLVGEWRTDGLDRQRATPGISAPPARRRSAGSTSTASISTSCTLPTQPVPFAESIGAAQRSPERGKVTLETPMCRIWTVLMSATVRATASCSSVNQLDFSNSRWRDMLNECETHEIGFIPYRPLRAWDDAAHRQVLTPAASRLSASTDQIALAWLLAVSTVTLPIPGTATRAHLERQPCSRRAPPRPRRDTRDLRSGQQSLAGSSGRSHTTQRLPRSAGGDTSDRQHRPEDVRTRRQQLMRKSSRTFPSTVWKRKRAARPATSTRRAP
jgi:hypothetical protein